MDEAKELIRIAHESGADIIKSQAFKAKDINGSMSHTFYEMCEFEPKQYLDLIDYARSIGNDLFYSVFSHELKHIFYHQNWFKIAGIQYKTLNAAQIAPADNEQTFISIPRGQNMFPLKSATVLHVTDYLTKTPDLEQIYKLTRWYRRQAGLSDHTIGIKTCIDAIKKHNVHIIEKHFTLKKNVKIGRDVYRDTVHGCDPSELERLANEMSNM